MTTTHATDTARPSAAQTRMTPTTDRQTSFADVLADVRLSAYWPLLADMLTDAIGDIYTAHGSECRRRDCRTCTAIRDATTWVQAHRQLDTIPCGCHSGCGYQFGIPHPTRGFRP